ncbi:MAG: hypothetical protein LBG87_02475 [Spirochaetaceae bacterium]|jgi:hypothetical protein|nr:hypothetical protein [Spirochaetaceae bacterium]
MKKIFFIALIFYACPMQEPPTGKTSEGLDSRLIGAWRFGFENSYEQCVITAKPKKSGNLGSLVFGVKGWEGNAAYRDTFGGDIVYAKAFRTSSSENTSAGIIIIEYWTGKENKWQYWAEAPDYWEEDGYRYRNRNFYGIYYINLFADGKQVFLACTNDQSTNYGPTETRTLEEAIAKFTEANLPNLLNLDVGDPHKRYTGSLDGYEGPKP